MEQGAYPFWKCGKCKVAWCLNCKDKMHEGQTCDQVKRSSQSDTEIAEMLRSGQLKQCPTCKTISQKQDGYKNLSTWFNFVDVTTLCAPSAGPTGVGIVRRKIASATAAQILTAEQA